jgi:hypothetical protein
MPHAIESLPVTGSIGTHDDGHQFVLHERLTGRDTFLTGVLELNGRSLRVRIITLDDVTVLRPLTRDEPTTAEPTWSGVLHVPHGARARLLPDDLVDAASAQERSLDSLDDAELRYALTFLDEATTTEIRHSRIRTIVAALPPGPETIDIHDPEEPEN